MRSRAVVQSGPRRYELRELDVPEIGPDQALLRIEQSGICGSDWSQYKAGLPFELIPGHEPLGVLEQVGELAAQRWGVAAGDRVAVETMLPCGHCRCCVRGRFNLCRASGPMIHAYGYRPLSEGAGLWGAHSQLMLLEAGTLLHRVDPSLPAELASLFNPLGAGVRWAQRLPATALGETVVVLGCGQRGLACVVAARAAGAGQVIVTGLAQDEPKLEVARAFGADRTVVVERESALQVVRELTDGAMADVVVEVTSGATEPVVEALDLAAYGGRVVLAGMKYAKVDGFDANKVMMKELVLLGALAVDHPSYEAAIRLIESRRLPLELMHTHTLPLAEADRAVRILGGEVEGEVGIHVSLVP